MDLDINGGRAANGSAPYVIFATPSLAHSVSLEFHRAYLDTSAILAQANIRHGCIQVAGCIYVANARNRLVTHFLKDHPEATDLFFIDDDIGWTPDAAIRFMASTRDVIAGIIPHKADPLSFPVELDFTDQQLTEQDGLFLAVTVPTAFLRIKRHVLEKMAEAAARYPDPDGTGQELYNIFETGLCDGKWWGEDNLFCKRWREMGGQIWVDPNVAFTHSGRKRYEGCLAASLRQFIEAQATPVAA